MASLGTFEDDAVGFHNQHDNYGDEAAIEHSVASVANSLITVSTRTEAQSVSEKPTQYKRAPFGVGFERSPQPYRKERPLC
jgi:hypothetical protein